jgi:hypothetical protein
MDYEDAPAQTGDIRIANIHGLGGYAMYRWPISQAGYWQPEIELHVRVMDSGEVLLSIEEDWDQATDD